MPSRAKPPGTKWLNYAIPEELHDRCSALAGWKGQPLKTWVIRALDEVAERQEAEQAEQDRRRRSR